jgi:uncharacterized membrane protein YuzA (DUF378 family)
MGRTMIDFIKHAFGLCGEGHANIFTLIFGSSAIGTYIYYILFKLGFLKYEKRNCCKK